MSIAHGHLNVGMSKKSADLKQRESELNQSTGKRMSDCMKDNKVSSVCYVSVESAEAHSIPERLTHLLERAIFPHEEKAPLIQMAFNYITSRNVQWNATIQMRFGIIYMKNIILQISI